MCPLAKQCLLKMGTCRCTVCCRCVAESNSSNPVGAFAGRCGLVICRPALTCPRAAVLDPATALQCELDTAFVRQDVPSAAAV